MQAIPSLPHFRTASGIFRIMLQIWMGLPVSDTHGIDTCHSCGKREESRIGTGRHWLTECSGGCAIRTHNAGRDSLAKMFRSPPLSMGAVTEAYRQWPTRPNNPVDVLVQMPEETLVIDVTVRDPTCKTYLDKRAADVPLVAAAEGHREKKNLLDLRTREAGAQGIPFKFQPLAFEATGAMGAETQKWWKSIVQLEESMRTEGSSLRDQGLDHTWSANSFSSYWRQHISMAMAKAQAQGVANCIARSRPLAAGGENRIPPV